MKISSLILFFFFSNINSFSQLNDIPVFPIDSHTGKISYKEVVYLDSTLQQQVLFKVAREWFAKSFVSANNVLQMEDEEAGILIGKGSIQLYKNFLGNQVPGANLKITISLYFKDGRYKYEITDLLFSDGYSCEYFLNIMIDNDGYKGYTKKQLTNLLNQVNDQMFVFINNFKTTMSNTRNLNESDW